MFLDYKVIYCFQSLLAQKERRTMAGNTYFFTHEQLTKLINGVQQPKDAILQALKPNVLPNPFEEEETPTEAQKPQTFKGQETVSTSQGEGEPGEKASSADLTHPSRLPLQQPRDWLVWRRNFFTIANIQEWDDDRMQEEFALELRKNVQRAEFARCDNGPQETENHFRSRLYYLYSQTHDDKDAAQIQLNLDNAVTAELPGSDRWCGNPQRQSTATSPKRRNHNKWSRKHTISGPTHRSPHRLRDNDLCWYCHNRGHMQKQCPEAAVQAKHFTRFFTVDRMGNPALKKIHHPPPANRSRYLAKESSTSRKSLPVSEEQVPSAAHNAPPTLTGIDETDQTKSAARTVPVGTVQRKFSPLSIALDRENTVSGACHKQPSSIRRLHRLQRDCLLWRRQVMMTISTSLTSRKARRLQSKIRWKWIWIHTINSSIIKNNTRKRKTTAIPNGNNGKTDK